MKSKSLAGLVLGTFLVAATPAVSPAAPVQGNLGSTSTGKIDVKFKIPNLVRISGLSDLDLGDFDGTAASGTINFCVYSTTRNYTVKATSANGDGTDFRMKEGTNYIIYDVSWTDEASTTVNLNHNVTSTSLKTNTNSVTCGSGTNTSLTVNITAAEAGKAPASNNPYTDTLTLLVTPQ